MKNWEKYLGLHVYQITFSSFRKTGFSREIFFKQIFNFRNNNNNINSNDSSSNNSSNNSNNIELTMIIFSTFTTETHDGTCDL